MLRERALPGERLLDSAAGAGTDECAGNALGDSEPAAGATRKARDREVGAALRERPEFAFDICVAEQERPPGALELGERQRLPLAAAREPDDTRPGRFRGRGRAVARAVVRDDHLRARGRRRAGAATVAPIRSSSSRAATRTVSSLTRPAATRARTGQHAVDRVHPIP